MPLFTQGTGPLLGGGRGGAALSALELARLTGAETEPNNPLYNVGKFLSRPMFAVHSLLSGEPVDAAENMAQFFLDWPTGGFLNRNWSLGNLLPESIAPGGELTSRAERPEFTDVMKRWGMGRPSSAAGRLGVDLVGGILADPLTYVTFGTAALGRTAMTGMGRKVALDSLWSGLRKAPAGRQALKDAGAGAMDKLVKKARSELPQHELGGMGPVSRIGVDELSRQAAEDVMTRVMRGSADPYVAKVLHPESPLVRGVTGTDVQGRFLEEGIELLEKAGLLDRAGWRVGLPFAKGTLVEETLLGKAFLPEGFKSANLNPLKGTAPYIGYKALAAYNKPLGDLVKEYTSSTWTKLIGTLYDKTLIGNVSEGVRHWARTTAYKHAGDDYNASQLTKKIWKFATPAEREMIRDVIERVNTELAYEFPSEAGLEELAQAARGGPGPGEMPQIGRGATKALAAIKEILGSAKKRTETAKNELVVAFRDHKKVREVEARFVDIVREAEAGTPDELLHSLLTRPSGERLEALVSGGPEELARRIYEAQLDVHHWAEEVAWLRNLRNTPTPNDYQLLPASMTPQGIRFPALGNLPAVTGAQLDEMAVPYLNPYGPLHFTHGPDSMHTWALLAGEPVPPLIMEHGGAPVYEALSGIARWIPASIDAHNTGSLGRLSEGQLLRSPHTPGRLTPDILTDAKQRARWREEVTGGPERRGTLPLPPDPRGLSSASIFSGGRTTEPWSVPGRAYPSWDNSRMRIVLDAATSYVEHTPDPAAQRAARVAVHHVQNIIDQELRWYADATVALTDAGGEALARGGRDRRVGANWRSGAPWRREPVAAPTSETPLASVQRLMNLRPEPTPGKIPATEIGAWKRVAQSDARVSAARAALDAALEEEDLLARRLGAPERKRALADWATSYANEFSVFPEAQALTEVALAAREAAIRAGEEAVSKAVKELTPDIRAANVMQDAVSGVLANLPPAKHAKALDALAGYFKSMEQVYDDLVDLGIFQRKDIDGLYVPRQSMSLISDMLSEVGGDYLKGHDLKNRLKGLFSKDNFTKRRLHKTAEEFEDTIREIAEDMGIVLDDVVEKDIGKLHLQRLMAHNRTVHHRTLWNQAKKLWKDDKNKLPPNVVAYLNKQLDTIPTRTGIQALLGGGVLKFAAPAAGWSDNMHTFFAKHKEKWGLKLDKKGELSIPVKGINYYMKPALTSMPQNLAFHFRNALSAVFMGTFDPQIGMGKGAWTFLEAVGVAPLIRTLGVDWRPGEVATFMRAMRGQATDISLLEGKTVGKYSALEVVEQLKGIIGDRMSQSDIMAAIGREEFGQSARAWGPGLADLWKGERTRGGLRGALDWWIKSGEGMANHMEGSFRAGSYMKLIKEGVNPTEAARRVERAFVKYDLNSKGERLLRDIVPFARFMIGSSAWLGEFARRPKLLTPFARTQQSLAEEGKILPKGVTEGLGMPSPLGADTYVTSLGLPHEASFNAVQAATSFKGARKAGLASLHPMLKAPLEQIVDRHFYFGTEAGKYRVAPSWFPRGIGITEDIKTPYGTRHEIPGWVNDALAATPASRALGIVDAVGDVARGEKGAPETVLKLLTGVRWQTIDQKRAVTASLVRWLEEKERAGVVGRVPEAGFYQRGELDNEEIAQVLRHLRKLNKKNQNQGLLFPR